MESGTENVTERKKFVLVTGAGGGMGKATVKLLLSEGYYVFALDKSVINLQNSLRLNEQESSRLNVLECDVSDNSSVLRCAETVKKTTTELFAIIHYAGVYTLDSLIEIPPEEFEKIFKINVFGAFYINEAFVPSLRENGRIITVTSELATLSPLPFTGLYGVTKGALDNYAHSLKMELQLKGIYVSVLRAGAVKTGMLGASTAALDKFCEKTKNYSVSAERFRKIVNAVESKCVTPELLAQKTLKILHAKKPKFAYSINRNFLLKLYGIAPSKIKFYAVKKILK